MQNDEKKVAQLELQVKKLQWQVREDKSIIKNYSKFLRYLENKQQEAVFLHKEETHKLLEQLSLSLEKQIDLYQQINNMYVVK